MKQVDKTNVMRLLEQKKIEYTPHVRTVVDGIEQIETLLNQDYLIYKTLVTTSTSKNNYVFIIPLTYELDLKKAAKAVNEKKIEMIKSKELLPLTGYQHGGCSPIGMKKNFTTIIDETALSQDTIIFSAGKVGVSVELTLTDLKKIINYKLADVISN